MGSLRQELERLEREAQAADRRRDLSGQLKEVGSQVQRTEGRLRDLEGVSQEQRRAEQELAAAHAALKQAEAGEEKARTAWVQDKQEAQTKLQKARDQYEELQAHRKGLQQAGPDGTCPTCLRPLGAEYEAVLGTLSRQLEELKLNGKYYRQRVEQLAAEPDEVRELEAATRRASARVEEKVKEAAHARERVRDRDELARELLRLGERRASLEQEIAALPDRYDAERHEAVRIELRGLEPTIVLEAELRVRADRAERLVAEAEAADRDLTGRETHLKQLTAAIQDAGFSEAAFAEARERYEGAAQAVREAELELSTVQGDLRAAEQLVEVAQRRLTERAGRTARLADLKAELRLHDELDRAFGDIRTDLNAQMRPELSEIASSFLAELTDGRYHELELDEEYQVLVLEDGLAKPVISGGEEDVANLVLRLAISQMVAERAGQPLSLLVLDEVFASLDEERREHVLALLRHLGDRFPQVVILTHVEAMRALITCGGEIEKEARESLRWDEHFQEFGYPEHQQDTSRPANPDAWKIHWQAGAPPPEAMSREEIGKRLAAAFPRKTAERLLRLALPAIGLWPQRPTADMCAKASRLGGAPIAPPGWWRRTPSNSRGPALAR